MKEDMGIERRNVRKPGGYDIRPVFLFLSQETTFIFEYLSGLF